MIIRIVRMTFREESVEDFLHIFNKSKSQIRNFPGCIHLELHRDASNPRIFCTYSHWETQKDLDAYRNSELFGKVWPATKALFDAKPMAFSNIREQIIK
ncbi:MAG: antibiotic biosynthesis monooxygenase [Cyclobacteriaceae bacterium]